MMTTIRTMVTVTTTMTTMTTPCGFDGQKGEPGIVNKWHTNGFNTKVGGENGSNEIFHQTLFLDAFQCGHKSRCNAKEKKLTTDEHRF